MNRLWRCPLCGDRVRAPERARKSDARRWCLACSGKTGKLVECVCDAAEARRTERAVRASAKRLRAATIRAAAADVYPKGWLLSWLPRVVALKTWGGTVKVEAQIREARGRKRWKLDDAGKPVSDGRLPPPARSSGHAWVLPPITYTSDHQRIFRGRFAVTAGTMRADALETMIHEIAHIVAPREVHHGDQWRSLLVAAVEELTGARVLQTKLDRIRDLDIACTNTIEAWLGSQELRGITADLIVIDDPLPKKES